MDKEGIQFLVSVKDAVLSEIIGRLDGPYSLTPCLLVEGFGAAIRRHRPVVRPVRGHYHLRYPFFQYRICSGASGRRPLAGADGHCELPFGRLVHCQGSGLSGETHHVVHMIPAWSADGGSRIMRWSAPVSMLSFSQIVECRMSSTDGDGNR